MTLEGATSELYSRTIRRRTLCETLYRVPADIWGHAGAKFTTVGSLTPFIS